MINCNRLSPSLHCKKQSAFQIRNTCAIAKLLAADNEIGEQHEPWNATGLNMKSPLANASRTKLSVPGRWHLLCLLERNEMLSWKRLAWLISAPASMAGWLRPNWRQSSPSHCAGA